MTLSAIAKNGERCHGQRLKFRLGIDDRETTEFEANDTGFHARLCDALIEHGVRGRQKSGTLRPWVYIQVWTTAGWRNVQRVESGNVVAIYFDVASNPETSNEIYRLACNSVQMARDLDSISTGLAREAT